MTKPQIVWLRRDLRMADNPALFHAAQAGPVIPVYVLDDEAAAGHAYGGASRWWLHHSLTNLEEALAANGSRLILRRGDSVEQLCAIAEELGAEAIHTNRHYEPWWRKAQGSLAQRVNLQLYDGNYLLPPGAVRTGAGAPYKIYTPFAKATFAQMPPRDLLPEPELRAEPENWPTSESLEDWGLLPTRPDWAAGIRSFWNVGEGAAHDRLSAWEEDVDEYDEARNLPSLDGSSRLSPHLHFGELSPAQVWRAIGGSHSQGRTVFEKELIWHDYATNIIAQFPQYAREDYREQFTQLAWRDPANDPDAASDLLAWQMGRTGYPIVDAGMRQLWRTGWMHNRVRMIAASFLIKHLLIHWSHGERWFWDTLVDADFANNAVNWQWVAGTGVDSNMFVRIMAPLSQSAKFDAAGYIREYVPELAHLDGTAIHDPEEHGARAPNYPAKIISHKDARERALQAYRNMKEC